ncbi:1,3-beta-glucanase [Methylobacterium sp. NI91]|nr:MULTISPECIES: 1,3-beta-glucanase [unclassified Methylobacterium]QIJ75390.1 1,3-beta-glucanase [Methylobacterium sp. CLZ]QIJ80294.1 1,3-beta-glucanase [Methylobacterium sp. NI91]
MATMRMLRFGFLISALQLGGVPALAQTSVGGLPSGFTAPGLPFGPTSTVATAASPTATMALANPGGLRFGGASGISGLGTSAPGLSGNAGGLNFGGASASGTPGGAGLSSGGSGIANAARRRPDDVTGSIGSGGGGAPAGAGISGGAGFSPKPTDAYFDPLSGSGLR